MELGEAINNAIQDLKSISIEEKSKNNPANIIEAWNRSNSYSDTSLFTAKLYQQGFTDSQIASILLVMGEVCRHCWDGPRGCQCWNDE